VGIFAAKVKRFLQTPQPLYSIVALHSADTRVSITGLLQGLVHCIELLFRVDKANGLTLGSGKFLAVVNNGFDCLRRCSSVAVQFEIECSETTTVYSALGDATSLKNVDDQYHECDHQKNVD
jgi:hypothetical protein